MTLRSTTLVVAGVVAALDQLTKWWVVRTLPGEPIVLIDGVLELRYVTNTGAAFSLFEGAGSYIALIAMVAVVFIFMMSHLAERRHEMVALGLVLGGAIGNLIDRVVRGPGWLDGGVVDFVDFSFFPAFNVADSAITIGAGLVLVFSFLKR